MRIAPVLVLTVSLLADAAGAQKVSKPAPSDNPGAPAVVVVAPYEQRTVVDEPEFTLRAVVYSLTIGSTVQVTITLANGRGTETKTLTQSQKQEFTHRLKLAPGENVLTVSASNEKATSAPMTKVVVYEPRTKKQDDLIYLGIGATPGDEGRRDLAFASADVRELGRLLGAQQGGPAFDKVESTTYADAEATRENIIKGLEWLGDKADEPEDVAFIFFEGRLSRDYTGRFYLLASGHASGEDPEIRGVDLNTVMRTLARFPSRVVFIIAGSLHGAARQGSLERTLAASPNVLVCTALTEEGESPGSPDGAHGLFASALFEGLNAKADANGDGFVLTDELMPWLSRRVREATDGRLQVGCSTPEASQPLRLFFRKR